MLYFQSILTQVASHCRKLWFVIQNLLFFVFDDTDFLEIEASLRCFLITSNLGYY